MKHINTTIVSTYLNNRQHNKVTNIIPLTVHHSQSNSSYPGPNQNKQCPLLLSYLNKIDEDKHPSPLSEPHTTTHLLNCTNINTQLTVTDLWTATFEVGNLLVEWRGPPVSQRARMPARLGDTIGRCA